MRTQDLFTRVIVGTSFLVWLVFLLYYGNATHPHEGGRSFLYGSGLTLVTVWGLFAIRDSEVK